MIKKALIWITVLLALIALSGAGYYYLGTGARRSEPLPPAAMPDNNVIAGPVVSASAQGITIAKQDGTQAILNFAESTQVIVAGTNGQPGMQKSVSDIEPGMMVLVTPSGSDASVAEFIVILPPPPVQ
jgi:hypothetical protein